jgi:hypothetical protein
LCQCSWRLQTPPIIALFKQFKKRVHGQTLILVY